MSRLDTSNNDITVYLEETWTDSDGNTMVRPSATGIPARVMIQPLPQSGTSARRAEQDNEGFETERMYRMRFTRSFPYTLGAQSRIEWNGQYWSIMGDALTYNSGPRTRHTDYTIRRN